MTFARSLSTVGTGDAVGVVVGLAVGLGCRVGAIVADAVHDGNLAANVDVSVARLETGTNSPQALSATASIASAAPDRTSQIVIPVTKAPP